MKVKYNIRKNYIKRMENYQEKMEKIDKI